MSWNCIYWISSNIACFRSSRFPCGQWTPLTSHSPPQQILHRVNSGERAGHPMSSPQKTNRTGNICIKMFMYASHCWNLNCTSHPFQGYLFVATHFMNREGFYNLFWKRMQDVFEKVWSQQDSATAHTAWISINQGGTGAGTQPF